jgi:hypothetical protein
MGVGTQTASAQSNKVIAFEAADGWKYHPGTEGDQVKGFLAERLAPSTGANEFDVVWIERIGDDYTIVKGWHATTATQAGIDILVEYSDVSFQYSELAAPIAAISQSGCGTLSPVDGGVIVVNGLAVDDPMQPLAAYFTPTIMQSVISNGSAGGIGVSEKEISIVTTELGEIVTATTKDLLALEELVETEIAGGPVAAAIFCWPGRKCTSTTFRGACTLSGGFGNGSCSGCMYNCVTTTIEACATVSITCVVGPTTFTTKTGTTPVRCSGDASNCPATPPGGC